MLRQEMPRISAACHHCSCPLMALRITCCTFIVRSTAGIGYPSIEPPLVEGGVLILPERTVHLLFPAAISLVIDMPAKSLAKPARVGYVCPLLEGYLCKIGLLRRSRRNNSRRRFNHFASATASECIPR